MLLLVTSVGRAPVFSVGHFGALLPATKDLSLHDPLLHRYGSQPTSNGLSQLVVSYNMQGGAVDLFLSPRVPTGGLVNLGMDNTVIPLESYRKKTPI